MTPAHLAAKALATATAALALAASVSACDSSSGSDDATYAPAAYGQQIGSAYDCYYIDDSYEVTDPTTGLIARGLCPRGAVATIAPLYWQEEYWGYYSSPAYYNTYMPVRYRSHYTSVTVVHFSSTYRTQIAAASSKGVYKSSTGQRVTGTSKLKFGSSSGSGSSGSQSVHGGGTRGGCAQSLTVVQMRSGSSGSSSSHGGGTRSGGSSGAKSGSGSGSRGGC